MTKIIYLEGNDCGTGSATFSVVELPDCTTNIPLQIVGVNATLADVDEAEEASPGGFIPDRTVHTNVTRTPLALAACGPSNAPGNLVLTWDSSIIQIYPTPTSTTPLTQFTSTFATFTNTTLSLEGIAPAATSIQWNYDEISGCADELFLTVIRVETETVATSPSDLTRKSVAVGEEVRLQIYPAGISGTWSTTGGNISPINFNTALLEAPHFSAEMTIKVLFHCCPA